MLKRNLPWLTLALALLACASLPAGQRKIEPTPELFTRTPAANPTAPVLMTPLPPVELGGANPVQPMPPAMPPAVEPTIQGLEVETLLDWQDAQALRLWMLFSHQRWQSAWADVQFDDYAGGDGSAPSQSTRVQLWVQQPGRFHSLIGPLGGAPFDMYTCDSAQVRQRGQPPFPAPLDALNYNPPADLSDSVYPHPFEGLMGSPAGALLFPQGLAQRRGTYQVLGQETYLDRPVVLLDWSYQPGAVVDRFWVDLATGIVLRWQNYGKGGLQGLNSEMKMNTLILNPQIPPAAFDINILLPGEFAAGVEAVP